MPFFLFFFFNFIMQFFDTQVSNVTNNLDFLLIFYQKQPFPISFSITSCKINLYFSNKHIYMPLASSKRVRSVRRCQILPFLLQLSCLSCLPFQFKSYPSFHRLFIDRHNKARNPYNRVARKKGAKGRCRRSAVGYAGLAVWPRTVAPGQYLKRNANYSD